MKLLKRINENWQQGLWISMANQDVISRKTCCCWVFHYFSMLWPSRKKVLIFLCIGLKFFLIQGKSTISWFNRCTELSIHSKVFNWWTGPPQSLWGPTQHCSGCATALTTHVPVCYIGFKPYSSTDIPAFTVTESLLQSGGLVYWGQVLWQFD